MVKRLVSILLVITLLIPFSAFMGLDEVQAIATTNSNPLEYNGNVEFKNLDEQTILDLYGTGGSIQNLLGGMPAKNAQNLLVNVEMLIELGTVVYGNPNSVSTNEHVAKTQRIFPSSSGYFKGGVMNALGEYRFLGRDLTGHAMTNPDFVPDELNPNRTFAQRTWVFQPWRHLTSHKIFGGVDTASPFHRAATRDADPAVRTATQIWINNLVRDGRGDIGGGHIALSTNQGNAVPFEHIHVHQKPTMLHGATGVMFHRVGTDRYFYQTLTGAPNKNQLNTPVITSTRVPTGQDLTFEKGATEVEFEVVVEGVLQDDDYFGIDELEAIHQDRGDIKHWEFELVTNKGTVLATMPVVNRRFGNTNIASYTFRVNVPSTEVGAGVVGLTGIARAVFFGGNSEDSGQAVARLEVTGVDFGSIFTVSENIVVHPIGSLTPEMISYTDLSFGDLTNYHWIVTHGVNTHNIHETPRIRDADISKLLRDIVYGEIGNETAGSFVFNIEQIVTQAGTSETSSFAQTMTIVLDNHQPALIEYETLIQPEPIIPTKVFDLAPLNARDNSPAGIDNRVVKINGKVVDDDLFFSGNFVFGTEYSDTWAFVEVLYTQTLNFGAPEPTDPAWRLRGDENVDMPFSQFIRVVDTKPKAQFETDGTFKENRLITITDDTTRANYSAVMEVYPIHSWEWIIRDLDGNNADLRLRGYPNGLVGQNHSWTGEAVKELLSKTSGSYEVSLVVRNNVEGTIRVSDPFIQEFHVLPDEVPAVITNLWAAQITRNQNIDMYYHVSSVDGDTIASETLRLYHDHDNNGSVDQFIMEGTVAQLTALTHAKLGTYKFTVEVIEEFGQPTIAEFVTPADRRRKLNEVVFWVDNLRPLTEIYVDIPIHLPEIDVHFITDQNVVTRTGANTWDKGASGYLSSNLVSINNALRLLNIRPRVSFRDLHTYVHETPASTTTSGSSRRPSSISYSSGGYSGTLTRFREDNIGFTRSGRRNETRRGTASGSRVFTSSFTNSSQYTIERRHWIERGVTLSPWRATSRGGSNNLAPSMMSVSGSVTVRANGVNVTIPLSGSIPRVGTDGPNNSVSGSLHKRTTTHTYIALYSGSVSGSAEYTYTVSVPYSYWVPRWSGNYSGTIYRNVKQDFTAPFRSSTAERYTIYISKDTINNMPDVNTLLATSDTKFILIGSPAIKSQLPHVAFFEYGSKPIDELVQDALNFIATSNPYVSQYTTLADIPTIRPEMVAFTQNGDTFNISTNEFEDEGDPIIDNEIKISQDPNYFSTSLGLEPSMPLDTWHRGILPSSFSTTGRFLLSKRIRDNPSLDPNFADFNYLSNEPVLEILSHRRPVAMATLGYIHRGGGNYDITWEDQSFDFDHVGRRPDRGIIESTVSYTRNGSPPIMGIPTNLNAGNYVLTYLVKDVEHEWSEPFVINFTLASSGVVVFTPEPLEFTTNLRTADSAFRLNSIPASEYLQIYDTWTRYADTVRLEVALFRGGTRVSPLQTINFNAGLDRTDLNFPKDIWWRTFNHQVPAHLEEGNYTLRVTAVDHLNRRTNRDFTVTVDTPINLSVNLPEIVVGGEGLIITATTSKYVKEGELTGVLFEGMLEGTLLLDGTTLTAKLETEELEFLLLKEEDNSRHWELTYFVATDIPEKTYPDSYTASFRAYAINHALAVPNFQAQTVEFELQQLKLEKLRITSIYDIHWKDNFLKPNNQPTNLKTEGIQIKDMPVYINDKHKWVRLGNIVEFEIDSLGLDGEYDEIEIDVTYHALDRMNKLHNVDIYVYDDNEEFVKIQDSQYNQIVYNLTLKSEDHRNPYKTNPTDNKKNTWEFILYLPPETRAVKRGRELDLVNRNHFDHRLLVVIDITAKKSNGLEYNYNVNAKGWGEDTGSIYGKNKPTKLNLLGHGRNRGEVFWFNLNQNVLEDIEIERGW